MRHALIIAAVLLMTINCGCREQKHELTMYHIDGQVKVFRGYSISRDNCTGEWSYQLSGEDFRRTFKGRATIRPILDLSDPPASTTVQAESDINASGTFSKN
jgi:hypothetical protein